MHGDDLHSVFSARLQTVDDGGLCISSGGRTQLSLSLLRTRVQDAVRSNDSLRTVPGDSQGGGVDV